MRIDFPVLDTRTLRIVATALGGYLGRLGTGIVFLVTVPMARAAMNPEQFGVWMMLTTMMTFFAFADLGVGNSVINRITVARTTGETVEIMRVLVNAYICTISVGIALVAIWGVWCLMADDPTTIVGRLASNNRESVLQALHIFVFLLALNIPASLIQKVQIGAQEGYLIGAAQLVGAIVTLIAVPAVLSASGRLPELILASLGTIVLVNLGNTALWLWRNSVIKLLKINLVGVPTILSLLRTGSQFLAIQVAVALAFQSDAIVITQLLGQAQYGDFAAVQKLFIFASILVSTAISGMWPAFGDAIARGESIWLRKAFSRALWLVLSVALLLSLALSLSMDWLIKFWLGKSATASVMLINLLALWLVIEAFGALCGSFLNAAGMVRQQVPIVLILSAIAFPAKWVLVMHMGVSGSILATIISYCIISVPFSIYYISRFFSEGQRGNSF